MAIYECVYIARQELTAAQTEQLSKDLTKIVSSNSGEIKKQEYWGLRNLAYKIRKNRKGHYTMFHIEAPASAIEELERNMRLNEDILRYLTVKVKDFDLETNYFVKKEDSEKSEKKEKFNN